MPADTSKLTPETYELLGAFYLGSPVGSGDAASPRTPLLYDARDLTTHGCVVGMTGSGKTGLCVSLLEEAAIDGIPSLVIDPKGDMANLMLGFPELKPGDFEPWIDPAEAMRAGSSKPEYAEKISRRWRNGLKDWGQSPDRIKLLHDTAEVALYTPGGFIGTPLAVLRSFDAPPPAVVQDFEAFRQAISGTVTGLLTLLGVDADPLTSREYMLLANIFEHAWRAGEGLGLADLLRQVQAPPFQTIGVMDLDTVFPARDRMGLAMRLNGLLASPGFSVWSQGEPMDISRLLWTAEGKPRVCVLSIAHLSDKERMFFVTTLLNEVIAWMRTQSGTSSLRALVYMDEVFGYLPPTANPPSKLPLMTLLKQARAFGLGVLLATQNPADLDYKALSNMGTWWLGRLQTERDLKRVLDGLEGAAAATTGGFDRARLEQTITGLDKRCFLMRNVHDDGPTVFKTRWALSYLKGPMSRDELARLSQAHPPSAAPPRPDAPVRPAAKPAPARRRGAKAAPPPPKKSERPVLPPEIHETFLEVETPGAAEATLVYRPGLYGEVEAHYTARGTDLDHWDVVHCVVELGEARTRDVWEDAIMRVGGAPATDRKPEPEAGFGDLPAPATKAKSFTSWERTLKSHIYKERPLTLWRCRKLKLTSEAGEDKGQFQRRLREASHELRDLEIEKIRAKIAPKLARLQEQIERAEQRVEVESEQHTLAKQNTAISVGQSLLGALFGNKLFSHGNVGRATSTARRASKIGKEARDVERAQEKVDKLNEKYVELELELEEKIEALKLKLEIEAAEIEEIEVRAKKSDTQVNRIALAWMPWWRDADGGLEPAFEV